MRIATICAEFCGLDVTAVAMSCNTRSNMLAGGEPQLAKPAQLLQMGCN